MCIVCAFPIHASKALDADSITEQLTKLGFKSLTLYGTPSASKVRFMYSSYSVPTVNEELGSPAIQSLNEKSYVFNKTQTLVLNLSHKTVTVLNEALRVPTNDDEISPNAKLPSDLADMYANCGSDTASRRRLLTKVWLYYNKHLFQSKMTKPDFNIMAKTEKAANFAVRGRWWASKRLLEMSVRTFNATETIFCEVLIHEMCHQAVSEIDRTVDTENQGHGPKWKAWMHRVGQVPSQYDKYDNMEYMDTEEKNEHSTRSGLTRISELRYEMPFTILQNGEQIKGVLVGPANSSFTKFDFIPDPPKLNSDGTLAGWKVVTIDQVYNYVGDSSGKYNTDFWIAKIEEVHKARRNNVLKANTVEAESLTNEGVSKMNELKELLSLFLRLNPTPEDQQIHALAQALGCDHQKLEEVIYRMLGSVVANVQDVSEGLVDPNATPLEDLATNDGSTTTEDLGFQAETTDDGVDVEDEGVGLSIGDQDVLTDDGIPDLSGA